MRVSAGTTAAKKKLFLNAYRRCGIIGKAAERAGIGRRTYYDWIAQDEQYKRDCEDALEDSNDALSFEVFQRATRKKAPSDSCLMFEVKKRMPQYRENYKVEVGGTGGGPVQVEVILVDPPAQDGS